MTDARGLGPEDERHIADLERLYLSRAGFGVPRETDGAVVLAAVRPIRPVAIVLDVGGIVPA